MATPRSAPSRAVSISSRVAPVSLGEPVTMRLISWTSLLWVFCRPALSLSNKPMLRQRAEGAARRGSIGGTAGEGGFEALDVVVRQLDGADQRFALSQAMTIGPARDEQTELGCQAEVALAGGGGVFGMKTFQAIDPGPDEGGNDFIGAIQSRMSHHGEAARLVDQFDGLECGDLEFRDPGRPALLQEALERLIQCGAKAAHHQGATDMRAAGRTAVGDGKDGTGLQGNVELVEAGDHLPNPVLADLLELGHFFQQPGISDIEEIAEQVQFVAVQFGYFLDIRNPRLLEKMAQFQ